jgi:hypothetical protein
MKGCNCNCEIRVNNQAALNFKADTLTVQLQKGFYSIDIICPDGSLNTKFNYTGERNETYYFRREKKKSSTQQEFNHI